MAILPLPQRGQPIDYDYMYSIAEAVNRLASLVSTTSSGSIIDKLPGQAESNVAMSQTLFCAKKIPITLSGPNFSSQNIDFGVNFRYPPIVTVTPYRTINAVGDSGLDNGYVDLRLTSVTETGCSVVIRYPNKTANRTMMFQLHLIAIGMKKA